MGKHFDKVFKENIKEILAALGQKVLKLNLSKTEDLLENIQHTIERQPDLLKKVMHEDASLDYALHMEFHVKNEEMVERLLEYYGVIHRETGLEVLQFVIFFGEKPPTMKTEISHRNLTFRFHLIYVREIDYQTFLDSSHPEEVVLAILGDFKGEDASKVIHQIAEKLIELEGHRLRLGKYLVHLEILSKLRKLQKQTKKIIESMSLYLDYDLETDIRYVQGKEIGVEQGDKKRAQLVAEIALKENLPIETIVKITELKKSEILKIKKTLEDYQKARPLFIKKIPLKKIAEKTNIPLHTLKEMKKRFDKEQKEAKNGKRK